MSISVIILTKDVAGEVIPALKTSKFADEIIVVDTGSTDNTLSVVRPYATKIVRSSDLPASKQSQDFAAWRNLGAKSATADWLLYLDSDERFTPALVKEILTTVANPKSAAYTIPRRDIMLGRHLPHWPDSRVLRLIKRSALVSWKGKLHEQPQIVDSSLPDKQLIGKLKNELIHLTHKNIDEKVLNTLNWSRLEAEMLFKSGHPPMKTWRFWRIVFTELFTRLRQGLWKDGSEGSIEIIYQTFSRFLTYVRLWELQHQPSLKQTYANIDKKILDDFKKN